MRRSSVRCITCSARSARTPRSAQGTISQLLTRDLSVIVLADDPLPDGPERDALTRWVEKGGLLIRMAGPAHGIPAVGRIRPAAAGQAAQRRPPARRRAVLEPPGRAGAVPPRLAVRRPGDSGGRDGVTPGAGRTLGHACRPHLGHPGRRHAAGDPGSAGQRSDRAVPCHRQRRLVQSAVVRVVRRYAAPPGGAVRRRADRVRTRGACAIRDTGRVRAVVAATTGRNRAGRRQIRPAPPSPRSIRRASTGRKTGAKR